MFKRREAISQLKIDCRGVAFNEADRKSLPENSVNAVVILKRDSTTQVLCPHASRNSEGTNFCVASKAYQSGGVQRPVCPYEKRD